MVVALAMLYIPNFNQLNFINNTFIKLGQFQNGPLIFGGDLNYVAGMLMDRSSPLKKKNSYYKNLKFVPPIILDMRSHLYQMPFLCLKKVKMKNLCG